MLIIRLCRVLHHRVARVNRAAPSLLKCGCCWMKAGYREKEVGLQGQEEPAGVDADWSRPLFLHSAEPLRAPLSSPTPPPPPLPSQPSAGGVLFISPVLLLPVKGRFSYCCCLFEGSGSVKRLDRHRSCRKN